jgi:hypothetical protein
MFHFSHYLHLEQAEGNVFVTEWTTDSKMEQQQQQQQHITIQHCFHSLPWGFEGEMGSKAEEETFSV